MGAGTSKIAVVAHDPLARAGLASLVGNGVSALDDGDLEAVLARDGVGLVVWDLGADVAAARTLVARAAALPVPVVALVPDALDPREALNGNVRALLARPPTPTQLAAAITAARAALVVLTPALMTDLLARRGRPREPDDAGAPLDALTAREREVLAGLAEGYSNRRIAQLLGIREATVKFHVNAILAKLDADSRTDAVVRAARRGLVMI